VNIESTWFTCSYIGFILRRLCVKKETRASKAFLSLHACPTSLSPTYQTFICSFLQIHFVLALLPNSISQTQSDYRNNVEGAQTALVSAVIGIFSTVPNYLSLTPWESEGIVPSFFISALERGTWSTLGQEPSVPLL
jgi:hypothetical protein